MSPIACILTALMALQSAPASPSTCDLLDNRCKAELFMQRAAQAPSNTMRANYFEAAHGLFVALYDVSGDVHDLCAARQNFDQVLGALGVAQVPKRLEQRQEALEQREQKRRPRCAFSPRKAAKTPILARARPPGAPSPAPPPALSLLPPPAPEPSNELMPVPIGPVTASTAPGAHGAPREAPPTVLSTAPSSEDLAREGRPEDPQHDAMGPTAPTHKNPARADRGLVIAGSVTLGLGLSLVGVAGYAGSQRIAARRASLELIAETQGQASADQRAQDLAFRDRYRTMGHLALGASLAGVAAVLVGTTLVAVGGRRLARVTRRMALAPLPGGLALNGRF